MNTQKIDKIIYPVKTKRGIKYGPNKIEEQQPEKEHTGKLLDGFLILFSCRVKLPHEAQTSKLTNQTIVDVVEEDLCYF